MAKKKRVSETWTAQVYERPVQIGGGECQYSPFVGCFVSNKFKLDDLVRVTVELLERKKEPK